MVDKLQKKKKTFLRKLHALCMSKICKSNHLTIFSYWHLQHRLSSKHFNIISKSHFCNILQHVLNCILYIIIMYSCFSISYRSLIFHIEDHVCLTCIEKWEKKSKRKVKMRKKSKNWFRRNVNLCYHYLLVVMPLTLNSKLLRKGQLIFLWCYKHDFLHTKYEMKLLPKASYRNTPL